MKKKEGVQKNAQYAHADTARAQNEENKILNIERGEPRFQQRRIL